jgi:ribonuclease HI
MYSLYTDGSANPNPGPCGCGAVLLDADDNILWTLSEYLGHGTNNVGELTAILRGCQRFSELDTNKPLTIYSDSELCVNLVTGTKKTKKPHLQNILDHVLEIKARTPFNIQWVKAHNNLKWNEFADKLADRAVATSNPNDACLTTTMAATANARCEQEEQEKDVVVTRRNNISSNTTDKIYLSCPFADKDKVKALGARWDPAKKAWWTVNTPENMDVFAKWFPN